MMNCQRFQDKVFEYLEGSLSASAQTQIEAHLECCAACRQTVQTHQALAARFRREADSLVLRPEWTRRIEAALAEGAASHSQGRDAALGRPGRRSAPTLLSVAQTSKSAVSRVSRPAGGNASEPTWKSAIQQVWKPALRNIGRIALNGCSGPTLPRTEMPFFSRRWAWPAAIAAALLVAAGLNLRGPFRLRVRSNEATLTPAPATVSVRFLSCDPTYTFRREKNQVIDALTCTPRVVEENLSLSMNQKQIPQTQERKTPL